MKSQRNTKRRSCCDIRPPVSPSIDRSEEHTSELQSQSNLVCRLLLEKKKKLARARVVECPSGHGCRLLGSVYVPSPKILRPPMKAETYHSSMPAGPRQERSMHASQRT